MQALLGTMRGRHTKTRPRITPTSNEAIELPFHQQSPRCGRRPSPRLLNLTNSSKQACCSSSSLIYRLRPVKKEVPLPYQENSTAETITEVLSHIASREGTNGRLLRLDQQGKPDLLHRSVTMAKERGIKPLQISTKYSANTSAIRDPALCSP